MGMVLPLGSFCRKPKRAGHSFIAISIVDGVAGGLVLFAMVFSVLSMVMTSSMSAVTMSMITTSPMEKSKDSSGSARYCTCRIPM